MVNALRPLDRKLVRDVWHLRGPAFAIAVIAMCGIASFVALRSMQYHLAASQATYYRTSRFADVFVHVRRAPDVLLDAIRAIPGVAVAEARVSGEAVLDVAGYELPASGHIVGIPVTHATALNRLTIRRGAGLAPGAESGVLVSEAFADAHGLAPGDSLAAVINGRWKQLHIVGVALSPEFIYELRPGDLLPNRRGYGVIWMDERAAAAAFGMPGGWNDLSLTLASGARVADVIARLDAQLAPYGTLGAYGRDLHVSHRFLTDEIEQNRTFAAIMPTIFLAVAGFLVHLVLSRVVTSQREQIGMLKAFGFSHRHLVRHFTLLTAVPIGVGALAGCGVGWWVAHALADMYAAFYRIPDAPLVPRASVFVVSIGISVVAAALGAASALQRVWRLRPADAMRPEPPPQYGRHALERTQAMVWLSPVWRMIVRTLARGPLRAASSAFGLALGVAVIIVGRFAYDSLDTMRYVQFEVAQREDLAVAFTVPVATDALREIAAIPGVLRVEPARSAPIELARAHRTRKLSIVGHAPASHLRRVVDMTGATVALPAGGIVISAALADLLEIRAGDTVAMRVLIGERLATRVVVAGTVNDIIGTTAYATRDEYARLVGDATAVSGAVLRVERSRRDSVLAQLERLPGVQSVASRDAIARAFDEIVAEGFSATLITIILFAAALAAGVTYNIARIALAERARDLASLRVLGFTRGEVASMLFGEQGVLAAAAVPAGFAIGGGLCWWMVSALQSDLFRLPLVIRPRTYAFATTVLVASWLFAAGLVRRRLNRLDLVAVLKTRE